MTRRFFLSLFGALASLPVLASRLRPKKPQKWEPAYLSGTVIHRGHDGCITAIALGPIQRGDLVVWDQTSVATRSPLVRRAKDGRDFARHVGKSAAVATCNARPLQNVRIQTDGQMLVRAVMEAP